ncbi:MAG: fimbrillin family protein [Muribaculaceae bacterium]|nr:fimbrillin family protein [Muribaculaceae bacterium]
MKKTAFALLLAAGSLAMVSCSQEDDITVNQGNKIEFRPALSRATETNNSNLSDITVAGFLGDDLYFRPTVFAKDGSFFVSSSDYYWPGDDSEVSFYAYAPSTLAGVTIDKTTKTLADFSPATSIADQVDFITANATGKKSENESAGVPLTFDHRLAQIEVRGKTSNENYVFKVTGIRIGQPVSTGSFDFTTDAWTLGTTKAIYESDIDEVTLSEPAEGEPAASLMGDAGNAMLLPQQLTAWDPVNDDANANAGAYISVKLQITTADTGVQIYPFPSDGNCQWAAIPVSTNWEAGKKYIYTLDFSHGAGYVDPHDPTPGTPVLGGPIKFTVTVTDWVDTPQDLDMKTSSDSE